MNRTLTLILRFAAIPTAVVGYVTVSGLTGFCPTCTAIVDAVRGVDTSASTTAVVAGTAPASVGTTLRDISAVTLDGEAVTLGAYQRDGRPMIIEVWATYCPPCRQQRAVLLDMSESSSLDATVVAIAAEGDVATVRRFVGAEAGPFIELIATPRTLQSLGGVKSIPALFFVDGDGVIRHATTGLTSADDISAAIATLRG